MDAVVEELEPLDWAVAAGEEATRLVLSKRARLKLEGCRLKVCAKA